jgi:hypothetical protein
MLEMDQHTHLFSVKRYRVFFEEMSQFVAVTPVGTVHGGIK